MDQNSLQALLKELRGLNEDGEIYEGAVVSELEEQQQKDIEQHEHEHRQLKTEHKNHEDVDVDAAVVDEARNDIEAIQNKKMVVEDNNEDNNQDGASSNTPDLLELLNSLQPVNDDHAHIQSDYSSWYQQDFGYHDEPASAQTAAVSSTATHQQDGFTPPSALATGHDLRKLTYAQALPVLSRLAADDTFIEALQELKSTQETFELSVLDERSKAKAELEKQLKKARESYSVSGNSYEVERITKLLNVTMAKFDKAALVRWDSLAKDQQARLEQLGVPCFYVLKNPDPVAQERQRRVMETLVTLLNDT